MKLNKLLRATSSGSPVVIMDGDIPIFSGTAREALTHESVVKYLNSAVRQRLDERDNKTGVIEIKLCNGGTVCRSK